LPAIAAWGWEVAPFLWRRLACQQGAESAVSGAWRAIGPLGLGIKWEKNKNHMRPKIVFGSLAQARERLPASLTASANAGRKPRRRLVSHSAPREPVSERT
jgi:hypothetical protein